MNATQMLADSYLDNRGIRRWRSNDQVPPSDCLTAMGITSPELARMEDVRDAELTNFLAEYRANQTEPTAEERFEMRAAFGPGATVVNVITGRTLTL
jgi:hypothetical protein